MIPFVVDPNGVKSKHTSQEISPRAVDSYLLYLLHHGYKNEMPLESTNQTAIAVNFERMKPKDDRSRTNDSRSIKINTNELTNSQPSYEKRKYNICMLYVLCYDICNIYVRVILYSFKP